MSLLSWLRAAHFLCPGPPYLPGDVDFQQRGGIPTPKGYIEQYNRDNGKENGNYRDFRDYMGGPMEGAYGDSGKMGTTF